MEHDNHHHMVEESATEYAKFFGLAIMTVVGALIVTVLMGDFSISEWMRYFMGLAWLVFAMFQLVELKMFAMAFASYDLIAGKFKAYAYAYPFIELAWSIMYFADLWPTARDISVLVLMTIGVIGIVKALRRDTIVECACLGTVIKLPLSKVTLSEDILMGIMAAVMLAV